jgi:TonB family protein
VSLAVLCTLLANSAEQAHAAATAPESVLLAETLRSVVVILDWDMVQRQGRIGSGIVVRRDRVTTQCQIIRKVTKLGVKQGGMRARARLVREDPSRDLCELEILPPGRLDPPSYRVRSIREIAVGEAIYAFPALPDEIGVPIKGNISAIRSHGKDKIIHVSKRLASSYAGGPWFDQSGALVGITMVKGRRDNDASYIYPAEYAVDAAHPPGAVALPQSGAIERPTAVVPRSTRVERGLGQSVARTEPGAQASRPSSIGQGAEANRTYLAQIVEASMNRLVYAKEVRQGGWSGTATIRFWLEPGGQLRESFVESSSGYAALDVAALVAVRKAIAETVMPDSVREHGFRGVVAVRHVEPATAAQSR